MELVMRKINIYTDGACSGNPGPGGWAAILKCNGKEKKISGFEKSTTNNRMELLALINALDILKEKCDISVFSDSKYLVDSISKGWVYSWQKNHWMRKSQKIPNYDLWESLLNLINGHTIKFNWVRGHSGHPENEECDRMAILEIKMNQNIT